MSKTKPDWEFQNEKNAWLIVRYMKGCYKNDQSTANRFTLTGGEKFKIGRIVFSVKEIASD